MPAAVFPRHRHSQEQITLIQRGEVRFTVGNIDHRLRAGGWSVVPPDVEHGLEAGEEGAEVLAIVIPPRDRESPYTMVQTGIGD
jgi:quercetin dioxygenase-like cupin family protein